LDYTPIFLFGAALTVFFVLPARFFGLLAGVQRRRGFDPAGA
jgi:hypothetical protein